LRGRINGGLCVRPLHLFFVVSAVLALAARANAESPFSFAATPCCLPKDVRPIAYRLDLKPDLGKLASPDGKEEFGFTGEQQVDIEVLNSTDAITLNAVDITFRNVAIDGATARVDEPNKTAQTATIHAASQLAIGRHRLTISYSGQIIPQAHGLYYAD